MKKSNSEAINQLKELVQSGDTLHCQLDKVSRSGMTRHIRVRQLLPKKNSDREVDTMDISYLIAQILGYKLTTTGSLKVRGAGMDMGFHVIYSISSVLFGDGYALKHQWL